MDRGEARRLAKAHLGEISAHTQTEYDRALRRLGGKHWRDYAEEHQATKRGAGVLRAAWRRGMAEALYAAVTTSDKAPTPEERQAGRTQMDTIATALMKDMAEAVYKQPEDADGHRLGTRQGAQSKKWVAKGLPPSWRAAMLDSAEAKDQAGIVALIHGARPEEVRMGVMITREGDDLIVTIHGAKVKEGQGQESRTIRTKGAHVMIAALEIADGATIEVKTQGQRLQHAVRRLASDLSLKGVSPYSFRHAFASDLKAAKIDPATIAKALGHQSQHTQSYYGKAAYGKRGGGQELSEGVVTVSATTEPRVPVVKEQVYLEMPADYVDEYTKREPKHGPSPSPFD